MAEPVKVLGWASRNTSGVLSPFEFTRRATGPRDVQFKVLYCGICHSDLHTAKNEWGFTNFPVVPGHEIVGEVTHVGPDVQRFKPGDKVGVGCMVDSCRKCPECANDDENYCDNLVLTYNSVLPDGTITQGGYSNVMVVDEHFAIKWPENFPLDKGAPLLCAGATTYSPLKHFGLDKPGLRIGVVGLGGLGHVAVKFAKAFGTTVTVISTSVNKKKEALEVLGADEFIVSTNADEMQAATKSLDGIIDTVSGEHSLAPLLSLLKTDGVLVLVGAPEKPLQVAAFSLIPKRRRVAGSHIAGIRETQEMIDFAAKHNVLAEVEMIGMEGVNTAMDRLAKGDVKYRFVIDVANSI